MTNLTDGRRADRMAAAIRRRIDNGRETTRDDLIRAGFSAAEVDRLGQRAVAAVNAGLRRDGRCEHYAADVG